MFFWGGELFILNKVKKLVLFLQNVLVVNNSRKK